MSVRRPRLYDGRHHGLDGLYDAAGRREGEQRFLILLGVLGLALGMVIGAYVVAERWSGGGPDVSAPGAFTGPPVSATGDTTAGTSADDLADAALGIVQPTPEPAPTPEPPRAGADEPTTGRLTGRPYRGPLTPVPVASAAASCRAPFRVDATGRPVRYGVGNTIDDLRGTAWGCPGNGRRETLTFRLGSRQRIGAVGLVPGYARGGRGDATDAYLDYRRISRVRWDFAGDRWIVQELHTLSVPRLLQVVRIPPVQSGRVTLTIRASVPGNRYDMVAISAVRIARTAR
ncbi:MAG: hypothetical protein M3P83_10965 [Actinomycetota bacterium]|nr:hypothetical protein [Actinomycetota bacterium]